MYDHEGDKKAGQPDYDTGKKRRIRDGPVPGGTLFQDDGETEMMERVNRILSHPLYREYYGKLERLEKDRKFCRHQMGHLLDVARIACIRNLEEGLGLDKEIIYAAAVLHDIGKSLQYEKKIPHETASNRSRKRFWTV